MRVDLHITARTPSKVAAWLPHMHRPVPFIECPHELTKNFDGAVPPHTYVFRTPQSFQEDFKINKVLGRHLPLVE